MARRRETTWVVFGQIAVAVAVAAVSAQEAPTIRTGIDLVRFDVIVTGKHDAVISDLTADDFEVVENGTRQTISVFRRLTGPESPDLHMGILLDVSGSMAGGPLQMARYTSIELLNQLTEAIDYTLVLVDGCVRVSRFSRDAVGQLIDRIREVSQLEYWADHPEAYTREGLAVRRRIEAYRAREGQPPICHDGTVLWDGLMSYLAEVQRRTGRHVLVAFTDAKDGGSQATFDQVRTALRSSGITLYGVGQVDDKARRWGGILRQIADDTGGISVFPYGRKQLIEVHRHIIREVRSQYTLGYVSTDERRDGQWRKVKIRLRLTHKDLRIRARDGYYAAKQ